MWRYYFQGAIYQLLVDGSTEDRKTVLGETQFFDPSSASTDALAVTIKASIVPTEAGRELFGDYFLDVYGHWSRRSAPGRSSRARAGLGAQG